MSLNFKNNKINELKEQCENKEEELTQLILKNQILLQEAQRRQDVEQNVEEIKNEIFKLEILIKACENELN